MLSSVSKVISFEWSTGKMKFDAWPVDPPGFGSGPLSIIVMSLTPSRVRWYARLFPTIPAPITTTRLLLAAPVMSARSFAGFGRSFAWFPRPHPWWCPRLPPVIYQMHARDGKIVGARRA